MEGDLKRQKSVLWVVVVREKMAGVGSTGLSRGVPVVYGGPSAQRGAAGRRTRTGVHARVVARGGGGSAEPASAAAPGAAAEVGSGVFGGPVHRARSARGRRHAALATRRAAISRQPSSIVRREGVHVAEGCRA